MNGDGSRVMSATTKHCADHGTYQATMIMGRAVGSCPTCRAAADAVESAKAAADSQARAEARRDAALAEIGLQGRYINCTLDSFNAATEQQRTVLAGCVAFAERFDPDDGAGLWLIGKPGTGKTHLGAAIARTIVERTDGGLGCAMTTAAGYVRRVRETWRPGSKATEQQVIDAFGRVHLLVLDEVCADGSEGKARHHLFDLLDLRYQLQRPTVLLSNQPVPVIGNCLGARLFDRMREGATIHVCDWDSHRAGFQRAR